jgi:hypothetical protein
LVCPVDATSSVESRSIRGVDVPVDAGCGMGGLVIGGAEANAGAGSDECGIVTGIVMRGGGTKGVCMVG